MAGDWNQTNWVLLSTMSSLFQCVNVLFSIVLCISETLVHLRLSDYVPSLSNLPASHLVATSFRKHVSESKLKVLHVQIKDSITNVSPQVCFS